MPHSTYLRERMGTAEIWPPGPQQAGSYATLTYTYTCGFFGIDDTGILKVSFRATSDMAKPQFSNPGEPNYTTVETSTGAEVECWFDRVNIRPWQNTVIVRLKRGFLREGDRIVIRFGDNRLGSPGMRLQTNVEQTFEFKTFVDAFATYEFVEIESSPVIPIVAGPPVKWKAILPTLRPAGTLFRCAIVAEDRWGNPADQGATRLRLSPTAAVTALPETVQAERSRETLVMDGLSVPDATDLWIDVHDMDGRHLCRSNPMRVEAQPLLPYWGDLHGQSEETCGTNTALEYFQYARDKAFVDIVGHQGNDFEITESFWKHLNQLTREFNRPGQFVAIPGYEWSGNTGMGGDRNVFFANEDEAMHRSSHVLVQDRRGANTDCHTAKDLFSALAGRDVVTVAHVGGRYADIRIAHDGRVERSVEIHSMWGTFEWLLHDALELGYRVGIVCNSDDHKGRQGAASPGAAMFGAVGGLTCFLAPALDRRSVFEAMRRRHHYGTTGTRLHLDVQAMFGADADLFEDDPALGPAASTPARRAMMGDIVRHGGPTVDFRFDVLASAAIERVDIFNGLTLLRTIRPFSAGDLGRRIRVVWEGAEYRGRGRQSTWDGKAQLSGNRIERSQAINFFNLDRQFTQLDSTRAEWKSLTTGNHAGFDLWLADPRSGSIKVDTPLASIEIDVAEIGLTDRVVEAGGLGRRLRLLRLPDSNPHLSLSHSETVELQPDRDNPLYARVTQEDGHQAWSSPIYVIP